MSDAAALRDALGRLAGLLQRSGEGGWAKTVSDALKNRDEAALARLVLSWFDDIGGLNGLVLSPTRGHAVASCALDATNRAFVELRREVFRRASAIRPP